MDTKFIREDFPTKAETNELNEIINIIHKDIGKEKEAKLGERFIRALFLGYKTLHERSEEKLRQKAISSENIQRLIRPIAHRELRRHIPELREIPEIKQELRIPKPISIPEKTLENSYTLLISDKKVLARVNITREQDGKYHYNLIEPIIDMNMIKLVKEYLSWRYKRNKDVLKNDKLIQKRIKNACRKLKIEYNEEYLNDVKYYLYRDLANFSKIDPLMHDRNVNSIICEGINKPIFIEYQNERIETNIIFNTNEELNSLIYKFAEKTNEEVNEQKPMLNVRYNEFRIQANLGIGVVNSRFIIKREIIA